MNKIIRSLFTRNGELAVQLKNQRNIVPLTKENRSNVKTVVGIFQFGPKGAKRYGVVKPIKE